MKLKTWLKENKKMSYSEYKILPEEDKAYILHEFNQYNCRLQTGWRQMTEEERKWADEVGEQAKKRYLISSKIGGTNGINYKALHYRWEE